MGYHFGSHFFCTQCSHMFRTEFILQVLTDARQALLAMQRERDEAEQQLGESEDKRIAVITKLAESERVCGELRAQLAQCFKLAGADDDGAADSLIAPRAVEAVRELRADYTEACDEIAKLTDEINNEAGEAAFDRMRN
jgi:hypothetical protein